MFQPDDMTCRLCNDKNTFEEEHHLIHCKELFVQHNQLNFQFSDVFSDLEKHIRIVKLFIKIIDQRKLLFEIGGL